MTAPMLAAADRPRPSIADAKAALAAWGETGDARVAACRSRVASQMGRVVAGAGVAVCLALVARRLNLFGARAASSGPPKGPDAPAGGGGRESPMWRRVIRPALAGAGRLLLPLAISAVRAGLAAPRPAPNAQPQSAGAP